MILFAIYLVFHFYAFRGDGYVEMDINVHRFSSVPKKALQILMKKYVTTPLYSSFTRCTPLFLFHLY